MNLNYCPFITSAISFVYSAKVFGKRTNLIIVDSNISAKHAITTAMGIKVRLKRFLNFRDNVRQSTKFTPAALVYNVIDVM